MRRLLILSCCIALAGMGCSDPVRNTLYAKGYQRHVFDSLRRGDSVEVVLRLLGEPLMIQRVSPTTSGGWELVALKDDPSIFQDPTSCYVFSYSGQLDGRKDFERNSIKIEHGEISNVLREIVTE